MVQLAKTPAFQAGDPGSNPGRRTTQIVQCVSSETGCGDGNRTGVCPRVFDSQDRLDSGFDTVWVVCRSSEIQSGIQERMLENDLSKDSVAFRLFRRFCNKRTAPRSQRTLFLRPERLLAKCAYWSN